VTDDTTIYRFGSAFVRHSNPFDLSEPHPTRQ
jgi:hypothetical protein